MTNNDITQKLSTTQKILTDFKDKRFNAYEGLLYLTNSLHQVEKKDVSQWLAESVNQNQLVSRKNDETSFPNLYIKDKDDKEVLVTNAFFQKMVNNLINYFKNKK